VYEEESLKLLIQPESGIAPLLTAIKKSKKSIEIVIFRFDRVEIEAALKAAVARGVAVNALIAYANRGGEKNLRKLEMRLLEAGVMVSRTADDLVRYHDKLLVVDRSELYVMSYNFTHMDIDHSRGFGVITRKHRLVQEALKLIEADIARKPYAAGLDTFIVSPINARPQLAAFLNGASRELLIYDPSIADTDMLRILSDKAKEGVVVRVIGSVARKRHSLDVRAPAFRLHTRTIIRDRRAAFIGSQSLRQAELDARREVGVIVHDPKAVGQLLKTFDADWDMKEVPAHIQVTRRIRKSMKAAVAKLSPLNPIVKEAVNEAVSEARSENLDAEEVRDSVEKAVKEAVRETVEEMLEGSGKK
jgi:phosphatidylserine/phosphatidylglycerophosphate/cardiolipin synthase-like enzyme